MDPLNASEVEAGHVEHIYVLMHGTWARREEWYQMPDSPLRKAIAAAEGESRIHFDEFAWTGRNATGARLAGAEALREKLRTLRQRYPERPISIVAHSHAGNIAMLALRDYEHAEDVQQVICLSTPFIHAAPRTLGRMAEPIIMTMSLLMGSIALLATMNLLQNQFVIPNRLRYADLATGLYSWLFPALLLLAYAGTVALCHALLVRLHRRNHRLADALRLPSSIPPRTLILRNVADEAGNLLGAMQLLSQLMSLSLLGLYYVGLPLFMRKSDTEAWPRRIVNLWPWFLGVTMVAALLAPLLRHVGFDLYQYAAAPFYFLWAVFVAFIVASLVAILTMPLVILVAGLLMACFGWSNALGAMSLYMSAESTPPGDWNVMQMSYESNPMPGMNHGTHSHPSALAAIAQWIREGVELRRKAPQPPA